MIGIGIANSLGVNLSGLSPAAKSFVTAAGISDPTKVKAINDLVVGLQSSGLWSKMKAVYPFVTDNRNLLSYTEDFGNAYWGKDSLVSVTTNSTTAPNGTLTADTITLPADASSSIYTQPTVSISTTYTVSFYIKATSGQAGNTVCFRTNPGATINMITLTNDWVRYSVVVSPTSTSWSLEWGRKNSATATSFFLWGAQLELGSTATTYQPIATTQQAFISNQFKYNLKDPRDTDAAFRLVFNGGWSFSSTGATPNGVNGYADTKLVPSSVLTLNSTHISTYLRTNVSALQCDMSVIQDNVLGVNDQLNIYPRYLDEAYFRVYDGSTATVINTNSQGLFIANRVNSTQTRNFKNSTLNVKTVASGVISTSRIILGAGGSNTGIPAAFSTRQTAFATIGDGLTDDDATNLYYYTQVFQTTLGRQIGSPAYALPTTYDASAKLYLSAIGSTTDSTLNNAVDTFIKGLKADGIYSKMKAVYPFATDNRNLLSYTEDFSNAFWYKNAVTITTNSVIAPNGTLTADSIVENTANTDHYVGVLSGLTLTAVPYTLSVYLKKAGRDWCSVGLFNGVDSKSAWFNLNTGVIGTINSGITANIESVGDGWYRCSVTRTMAANSNNYIGIGPAISDGGGAYLGNGSTSIYLWGAQLELGSTATTYQPILTTQQAYISSQFKYNMVNPQDDDSAFRLVFNGGWTHSANGATPNGTNGYADTKFIPSSNLVESSQSASFYSRSNVISAGVSVDFSSISTNGNFTIIADLNTVGIKAFTRFGQITDVRNTSTQRADGFFVGSRTASNVLKLWRSNVQLVSTQTVNDTGLSTVSPTIGAENYTTGPAYFAPRQCAFAHIGNGLTDTEAANLYSRVQALQTALNRQV